MAVPEMLYFESRTLTSPYVLTIVSVVLQSSEELKTPQLSIQKNV